MDQELTKNRLQEIDSNQRQGVEPVSITLGGSDPGRGSGSDYRLLGNGLPIGTGDYPTRKRRRRRHDKHILRYAELETLTSVIAAKGENDKARDIAVFFALRADSSYNQDRETERILEHKRATLEAEIDRLRREYRIVLIDYEKAQLSRRDAA